jgi:hypothetical protein
VVDSAEQTVNDERRVNPIHPKAQSSDPQVGFQREWPRHCKQRAIIQMHNSAQNC